jgi:hypothetical protein
MEKTTEIKLTDDELLAVNSALNELLNGPDAIKDTEFLSRVGVSKDVVGELLEKIHRLLY